MAFGERAARNLEQKLGLKPLFFDSTPPPECQQPDPESDLTNSLVKIALVHATEEEITLLTAFNCATDMGKKMILTAAQAAPKDPTKLKLVNSAK